MSDNQAAPAPKESTTNCECPPQQQQQQPPQQQQQQQQAPLQQSSASLGATVAAAGCATNVVTIPVPVLQTEGNFAYVTVKGSLHDYTCTVFGLNQAEVQALSTRLSIKPCVNGMLIPVPPMVMLNTLAQLSYKVVCSCGEAEICWTMQREV